MSEQEFLAKANQFLNAKMESYKRRQEEDLNTLLESWKLYCVKALAEERAKLVKELQSQNKQQQQQQHSKEDEKNTTTTTETPAAKPKPQQQPKKQYQEKQQAQQPQPQQPQPQAQQPQTQQAKQPKQSQQQPRDKKQHHPNQQEAKPSSAPATPSPKEKPTPEIPIVLPECQYASELNAVETVSSAILAKKPCVVVFTSLWNKRYAVPSKDSDLATFVIATNDCVNVLHMAKCSFMPKALTEIIMSKEILKVGFQINKDYDKLYKEFNQLYMCGAVELNNLGNKVKNVFEMGNKYVPSLVASEWYNSSAKNEDWGQVDLTKEQTNFAYQLGALMWNILQTQHAQAKDKYPDMYDWVLKTRKPQF